MTTNKHLGEYIRDNKRRKLGFLIGYKDSEGEIRVGWSLYAKNKEDLCFNRYTAKALAYMRASRQLDSSEVPPSIKEKYKKFLNRCSRYFKVPLEG